MSAVTGEDIRSQLFDVANRQAGYFTAMQAKEAGYSYPNQTYHKKEGYWSDEGWGIFRLRDYPEAEHEAFVKLSLWSRSKAGEPQAVISHESALDFYNLSDVMPSKVHLSVPKRFRKEAPPHVILHKADLREDDYSCQQGFKVTAPLRTLLDVADSPLSPEHLERATLEAIGEGWIRRSILQTTLSEAPSRTQERFAFLKRRVK